MYVITALPADIPATTPVVKPMAATAVFALLHVPPGNALNNVVLAPSHTTATPVIPPGTELTVNGVSEEQPSGVVYLIIVDPASKPLTMPVDAPTDAIAAAELHVPPGVALLSIEVCPWQMEVMPVIAAGSGLTVTRIVAMQPAAVV